MRFKTGRPNWFVWPCFTPWLEYPYPDGIPYIHAYPYTAPPYAPLYSYPQMTQEQEVACLQEQARMLKQEYHRISDRLKELQGVE